MLIALGQINPTVGDLAGNARLMAHVSRQAAEAGAELVVFPELSLTGYPPRDLVDKPGFLESTERELGRLARETADLGLALICGYAGRDDRPTNSAAVLFRGDIVFRQQKMLLPTYDVFDEGRNFEPAERQALFPLGGANVALTICEDAWNDNNGAAPRPYERNPVAELINAGGDLLIVVNGSPYHMHKRRMRHEIFAETASRHHVPVVYVNQVGGNDQLIFDGSSFVMDAQGRLIAVAASFREDLILADTGTGRGDRHDNFPDEREAVYEALVIGTRDYLRKCGFKKVLIGLSGGIDSSLTAVIALDAVGRENVVGVAMPGPYSSDHSLSDARELAGNLGIRFEIVSITPVYEQFLSVLDPVFGNQPRDVTEENLQARLRGNTLMALSNKWGALVLTTGNKSELAVGYCTLYGDMCGGLAVISDVPKTLVYELARVGNCRHPGAIPENVFLKPPSAELRANQKDSDSLPEYDVLDRILKAYIEDFLPPQAIAEQQRLPLDLVRDIVNKVDRNEYKRQQAPPGLKVTTKAFGIGRRFPIAQRFFE